MKRRFTGGLLRAIVAPRHGFLASADPDLSALTPLCIWSRHSHLDRT